MKEPSPINYPKTKDDESQEEVEELLPSDDKEVLMLKMCQEGGTQALNFLIAKAVSPTAQAPTQKSPK
jgi:hypothetical protein